MKGKSANYSLVYNPGQPVIPEEYMSTADVFCTFEGSAESYNSFVPASYTNDYPSSKFFHQVYGAGTTAAIAATLQQFHEQHAKWLYMTELVEPNPYDPLAGNAPWTALLNYMSQPHGQ